ncbi:MAG: hypothetical protein KIG70_06795 [Treponema sp.]|uniref:hypothetical protein n=1 Tax=Treponema sp. TaxID=166 RepID=UPI001D59F0CE|nr:hypothetical protein [Treponema sp.]MBS7310878.1 hypothetical protein [Treponema sp.]
MTKRAEKTILAVFGYCVKAALLASKEGVLALEDLCHSRGINESGEILFSRKTDIFLATMLRIIVDGCYTLEANQSCLNKLSKYSSKKNKLLLKVASVCMDGIANGKDIKDTIVGISPHIGVDKQRPFWDLYYELKAQDEKDFEYKLTEEQKKRIIETNVFFRMKEDECNSLLKQKNEKLSELHSRVPEFKEQKAWVGLVYKPKGRDYDEVMYSCSIPETDSYRAKCSREIHFIGEIPVCASMNEFWYSYHNCSRNIKKFMTLTEDIPKNIEKYLSIKSTIKLMDEEG